MQKLKPEYAATVLSYLIIGKTEKEISIATQKHRNTVSKYVKYLREKNLYDPTLLKNKILQELDKRLPNMEDHDLIAFYGKVAPAPIQITNTEDEKQNISFRWMTEPEWNNKLSSDTVPIVGKDNFTKAKHASAVLPVEEGGVKPAVAQTNS